MYFCELCLHCFPKDHALSVQSCLSVHSEQTCWSKSEWGNEYRLILSFASAAQACCHYYFWSLLTAVWCWIPHQGAQLNRWGILAWVVLKRQKVLFSEFQFGHQQIQVFSDEESRWQSFHISKTDPLCEKSRKWYRWQLFFQTNITPTMIVVVWAVTS